MVNFTRKEQYTMEDLIEIVRLLRMPEGCPWDREQDHHSIRKNLIEETYEVAEAIDKNDALLLREELGDLLLQIVLHAQMENEAGAFNYGDVCNDICQKLILRHPHVFADVRAESSAQVLKNWEEIKQRSKGQTTAAQTLESVPSTLPALMRAKKVQQRAAKVGFDYPDLMDALGDLRSEIAELSQALESGERQLQQEGMGDVLFSAVNVARLLNFEPEETLGDATGKFIRCFAEVERLACEREIDIESCEIDTFNELWGQSKDNLKASS